MARGEPVLDPATGRTSMLAAEYAAVLDHLQGEKERLAAATAAAAGATGSAGQPPPQQLQQQVLQEAGGSGGFEAGSNSNSRHTAQLVHMPAGLQEGRHAGQVRPGSDNDPWAGAPYGMQAGAAGSSSAGVAADTPNSCPICKHASSAAAQDSAVSAGSVRASGGGSDTGVAHGSPDGRHAFQGAGPRWVCICARLSLLLSALTRAWLVSVLWQQLLPKVQLWLFLNSSSACKLYCGVLAP